MTERDFVITLTIQPLTQTTQAMMTSVKLAKKIEIKTDNKHEKTSFSTLHEVERWTNKEIDYWTEIRTNCDRPNNLLNKGLGKIINSFSSMKERVKNLKDTEKRKNKRSLTTEETELIEGSLNNILNYTRLFSYNNGANYILQLTYNEPYIALALLGMLGANLYNKQEIINESGKTAQNAEVFEAWIRATVILEKWTRPQNEDIQSTKIALNTAENYYVEMASEMSDVIEKTKQLNDNYEDHFHKMHDKYKTAAKRCLQATKNYMNDIKLDMITTSRLKYL